jgi:hypothetical protein
MIMKKLSQDFLPRPLNIRILKVKGFVALGLTVTGLFVLISLGILPMLMGVSREPPIAQSFDLTAINKDYIGNVYVELTPSEAFVVYDEISANVTARLFSSMVDNGSARVRFGIAIPQVGWEYVLELVELNASTNPIVYCWNGIIRCYNEGVLEAHLYIASSWSENVARNYETNEKSKDFFLSNILQIKPYSYLEQRRNTHLTTALAFVVLGLSIISMIPAIDRVIEAFITIRYP